MWSIAPVTEAARDKAVEFDRKCPALRVTRFHVPYFEMFRFVGPDTATARYRARERDALRDAVRSRMAAERPDVLLIGREMYGWHLAEVLRDTPVPSLLISHGGPSTSILHGGWPAARAREFIASLSAIDVVVSVARHWQAVLRRLGVPRVCTIPNPVDLRRFRPGVRDPALARSLGIRPDDTVVMHASNLAPVKRALDVLTAAKIAQERGLRLVTLIVGDGPQREAVEEMCRGRRLNRVHMLGWIDHQVMPAYHRLADLVVSTSEHETQSLVYLETQATGRCLIATDVPGAREVVTDGKTGLLFRPGDAPGLAALILAAATDPARRAAIGKAARRRVRAHASPRIVAAYERILATLAAGIPIGASRRAAPDAARRLRRPAD